MRNSSYCGNSSQCETSNQCEISSQCENIRIGCGFRAVDDWNVRNLFSFAPVGLARSLASILFTGGEKLLLGIVVG